MCKRTSENLAPYPDSRPAPGPSYPRRRVSSTPRPVGSVTAASGILGRPPQCAIAHKAGDDSRRYSRGAFRPGFANRFAQSRGRRECRVLAAPAVSRARDGVRCAHEHTGTVGALRHSLRNGFTAYAALSRRSSRFVLQDSLALDRSPPQIPFRSARLHFSTRHTVILYPKFSQVFGGQGVEPVFLYASARGGLDADGMLRTCSLAHLRW
jgi:hypothetical protein